MKTITTAGSSPVGNFDLKRLHQVVQEFTRKYTEPALDHLKETLGIELAWDDAYFDEQLDQVKKNPVGTGEPSNMDSRSFPFFVPVGGPKTQRLETTGAVATWLKEVDPSRLDLLDEFKDEAGDYFIDELLEAAWLESQTL